MKPHPIMNQQFSGEQQSSCPGSCGNRSSTYHQLWSHMINAKHKTVLLNSKMTTTRPGLYTPRPQDCSGPGVLASCTFVNSKCWCAQQSHAHHARPCWQSHNSSNSVSSSWAPDVTLQVACSSMMKLNIRTTTSYIDAPWPSPAMLNTTEPGPAGNHRPCCAHLLANLQQVYLMLCFRLDVVSVDTHLCLTSNWWTRRHGGRQQPANKAPIQKHTQHRSSYNPSTSQATPVSIDGSPCQHLGSRPTKRKRTRTSHIVAAFAAILTSRKRPHQTGTWRPHALLGIPGIAIRKTLQNTVDARK